MLIGSDFNRRCEKILLAAGREAEFTPGKKVSVEILAQNLTMDRVEIRQLFQYLADLKLIVIESIGGPSLFGHITLTNHGIDKIKSFKNTPGKSGD